MEHLFSIWERRELQAEIDAIPSIQWLGFSHDTPQRRLTSMEGYPLERGWTQYQLKELKLGNLSSRQPREVLAMFQSWMFFGLFEAAFEQHFETKLFVQSAPGGIQTVNTSRLRQWIDDYHTMNNVNCFDDEERLLQRQGRLIGSLTYAASWYEALLRMEKDMTVRYSALASSALFAPVMRLSALVGEAVWAVAQRTPSFDGQRFSIPCEWAISRANDQALTDRCQSRGWCRSMYEQMKSLSQTPNSFFEYISLVPPFEHRAHAECTDQCVEYNIDELTYRPKHVSERCECDLIRPPIADVNNALSRGRIPLVDASMVLQGIDCLLIEECPAGYPSIKFVAFSHVWSDGLGSTSEAGLPRCQVKFLAETSVNTIGIPVLWIDSLCIPEARESRKRAISLMSATYRNAAATVVIDSIIRKCSFESSLETRLLSMGMSTWQQRLWTLQESSLSRNVIFMFKDHNLVQAEKTVLQEYSAKMHRPVIRNFGIQLDNLSDWNSPSQISIGGVQRNLYRRTSSKLDDEALAIAPFFPNVDLRRLLDCNGEERMIRFWRQVAHVPRDIVSVGPSKLSRPGFRWAPRTFMNQKTSLRLDIKTRDAEVTDLGLRATFWVYELHLPSEDRERLDEGTWLLDFETNDYVRLAEHTEHPNLAMSRSHQTIACLKKPEPAGDSYIGILLSKVSAATSQHNADRPVFQYEGIISVEVLSPMTLRELDSGGRAVAGIEQLTKGGCTGTWSEILIR